jgi:ribonuclease Z
MLRVTILGTAAARPTPGRNVSALAVQRDGDLLLFDCGEGTQRQMMRYSTGFNVRSIFITHLHADHVLGLTGLLRTMALQGRTDPIHIYGPPHSSRVLRETVHLGVERVGFGVRITELEVGEGVEYGEWRVEAIPASHGTSAVGWALREDPRLGRFDVDRARELGVPEGPLFGRLHRGEAIEVDGRTITPDDVVGPPRPGRLFVYTGDTRPTEAVQAAAQGADLLIHDATFLDDEADRARETGHSTASGAARLAHAAGVRELVLTHLSARYSDAPHLLEQEARAHFPRARVAHDGMVVEVGYADDETGPTGPEA